MGKYPVEYLPLAEGDIAEIISYYLGIDTQVAIDFRNDVDRGAQQLSEFPESAPLSRSKRRAKMGYRVLVLKYDYLLFFKFQNEKVIVYRVIRGNQDYDSML